MAEKSSVLATPKRIKALLSSFIHKDEKENVENVDRSQAEAVQDIPRSYQPRNRDAYFARVETFSAFTWFAKPIEMSPLRCAQYGWENFETDVLKCVSCKEIICATLPNAWESELYAKRFEEVKAALSKGHSSICAWSDSPSPDFFLTIPLLSQTDVVKDFKRRFTSLTQLKMKLPKLDTNCIEKEIAPESLNDVIQMLLKVLQDDDGESDTKSNDDPNVLTVACMLALCGWSNSSTDSSSFPTVSCQYCRRKAGLWNFNQLCGDSDESTEVVDSSTQPITADEAQPVTKKRKYAEISKDALNPLTEHRSWCPWVISYATVMKPTQLLTESPTKPVTKPSESPVVDSNTLPGWKALLACLAPNNSPCKDNTQKLTNKQQTPPNQAWKAVRKLLKFWESDPKKK